MIQVLRSGGDAGFGLDGLFQRADCRVGRDFEGEKIVIILCRSSDVKCDTPGDLLVAIACSMVVDQHLEVC